MMKIVLGNFNKIFINTKFSSKQEFEEEVKEADLWWKQNYGESNKDYEMRIKYNNRPAIYGVILAV